MVSRSKTWMATPAWPRWIALGADLALPPSIQADAIDVDTAASGDQRSGLCLAGGTLVAKLALAAAVGIAFPLLAIAGFDPAAGEKTELGLSILAEVI